MLLMLKRKRSIYFANNNTLCFYGVFMVFLFYFNLVFLCSMNQISFGINRSPQLCNFSVSHMHYFNKKYMCVRVILSLNFKYVLNNASFHCKAFSIFYHPLNLYNLHYAKNSNHNDCNIFPFLFRTLVLQNLLCFCVR